MQLKEAIENRRSIRKYKYIQDKKFELTEEEYKELDNLAELMLEPNDNFDKLQKVWKEIPKFRIMSGALNS